MTREEAMALAYRITSDFERARLVLPLMVGDTDEAGTVPYLDLYDVPTGEHVGRIFSEEEYVALIRQAWEIPASLN